MNAWKATVAREEHRVSTDDFRRLLLTSEARQASTGPPPWSQAHCTAPRQPREGVVAMLLGMSTGERRARWSTATFLLAFGATLLVVAWISFDFLIPLLLALSAAILLGRWNEGLVRRMGGRRRVAALLMSIGTLLVILTPLVLITVRLILAAIPLIERIGDAVAQGEFDALVQRLTPDFLHGRLLGEDGLSAFQEQLGKGLTRLAAALASFATSLPRVAANLLVDGFVTLVALYSFFVSGPRLVHWIIEATPMERRYTRHLLETIGVAIRTVFAASFVTALVQFALGYIAFRVVRLPYALGLAAIMGFLSFIFSLVPVLGSGLVWVPAGVALLLSGRIAGGIFILAWGALVLGSVDNVIKPIYAKGRLQLSPLVVFVTLFGGISVFGPIGALLGPLFAALTASFLLIWTTDFLSDAKPPPPLEPARPRRKMLSRGKPGEAPSVEERHPV